MHSRWYNLSVVVLWLASMTWLFVQKVLPPLRVGQPPSYRTIVEAQRQQPPVGWSLWFNGRRMGWAISSTAQSPNQYTEVRSRVHFEEVPLDETAPGWVRALLQLIQQWPGRLQMDARSMFTVDSKGHLIDFDSVVRLKPSDKVFRLQGAVEGNQMSFTVRSDEFSYSAETYLPLNGLLGDALSPQAQLPGLRTGQTWTVPCYNPLRPRNPLDILYATVEGLEPIVWNGQTEETFLVVYRNDPGYGLGTDRAPRGRLWVRRDGTVLKQQVVLFESTLTFERMPQSELSRLEEKVAKMRQEEQTDW